MKYDAIIVGGGKIVFSVFLHSRCHDAFAMDKTRTNPPFPAASDLSVVQSRQPIRSRMPSIARTSMKYDAMIVDGGKIFFSFSPHSRCHDAFAMDNTRQNPPFPAVSDLSVVQSSRPIRSSMPSIARGAR
jgi:hypothetical protein